MPLLAHSALQASASAKRAKSSSAAAAIKSARLSSKASSLSASKATSASLRSSSQSVAAASRSAAKALASASRLGSLSSSKAASSLSRAASLSSAAAARSSSKSAASASASASKSSASAAKAKATAKVASVKTGTILASTSSLTSRLTSFVSTNCGAADADSDFPNGAEAWLNCGISKSNVASPWTPPNGVTINDLAYVSLEDAIAGNSVWEPCKPYVYLFEKWGVELGIPPIMLASFAMQESTCNADCVGDSGGAFGLMQITEDKCDGRDATDCADPDFNVETGAKYFASQLSAYNDNVLTALGQYNGWYAGLTYAAATAAATGSCCECQNNLDYLHQFLNGWMLGKTGYELGSFGNLDSC